MNAQLFALKLFNLYLKALNYDVLSANAHMATRQTYGPTSGNATRAFASPAPTARAPSRATTRSGATFSVNIATCPEESQPSSTRPASCLIRSVASRQRLPRLSRIRKHHVGVEEGASLQQVGKMTTERVHLNPEVSSDTMSSIRAFQLLNKTS